MEIEKLKQKILDLAIRGKLVPQDPSDEPASVLIDRIHAEKEELIKQGKIKRSKEDSYIYKGRDNCYYEKVGDKTTCINDEIPFDIPNNWTWIRLCNVGIWKAGSTPLRSNPKYYGGKIAWLKTGELNEGTIVETEETVTDLALEECSLHLNPIGAVLIAMYGATIGKLGIAGIELCTNQACCACVTNDLIVNQYLFFYLKAIKSQLISKSAGGAQPNISREILINTLIALPPKKEQYEIIKQLEVLLDKTNKISQQYDEIGKLLYILRAKILEDIFGENSRYKSYYMHYGTLSDFGTLISGRDLKPDEYNDDNNGVPYLTGASNFENDTVIINRWTPCPVVLSLENDVLITCKGTIGKTAINKIKKCHIARQIMAFRCNEKVLPGFLKLYFEYMTTTLQKASSSLIPGITRSIMLSLNVASPPIEKQQEIIENTQKIMLILESIIY